MSNNNTSVNPVRIEVLQRDIDRGGIEATTCPIARAVKRALGRRKICVTNAWVYSSSNSEGEKVLAKLPPRAQRWILYYDTHRVVEPFTFSLKLVART